MITKNQIRFVKSLQQKKFRNENSLFVVEGLKMVQELLQSDFEVDEIYVTNQIQENSFPENSVLVGAKDMERMSGMVNNPGILAVVKQKENRAINPKSYILILDDIKDPGNLGTIIRTAEWFGIQYVLCSPNTAEMYNPKVVQSSMGSIFRVPLYYGSLPDEIKKIKEAGIPVLGSCLGAETLEKITETPCAWVIGSESHGMSEETIAHCDRLYEIKGYGKGESLNAAVATGIVLSKTRN